MCYSPQNWKQGEKFSVHIIYLLVLALEPFKEKKILKQVKIILLSSLKRLYAQPLYIYSI